MRTQVLEVEMHTSWRHTTFWAKRRSRSSQVTIRLFAVVLHILGPVLSPRQVFQKPPVLLPRHWAEHN